MIFSIPIPWSTRSVAPVGTAVERSTSDLAEEIKQTLKSTPEEITAYQVKRRVYFMGRWMRHMVAIILRGY